MEQWEIELLREIEEDMNKKEEERKAIIKNGCPHTKKIERIGLFSKEHYLECEVCKKQFYMDGTEFVW